MVFGWHHPRRWFHPERYRRHEWAQLKRVWTLADPVTMVSLAFHGRGGVAARIRGAEMVTRERGMLST